MVFIEIIDCSWYLDNAECKFCHLVPKKHTKEGKKNQKPQKDVDSSMKTSSTETCLTSPIAIYPLWRCVSDCVDVSISVQIA